MLNNRVPIAWLPADSFTDDAENEYLSLFTDLIATGASFRAKMYSQIDGDFELSVEVAILRTYGTNAGVQIILQATKRFQKLANVEELEARSYKRGHPTSTKWTRTMAGTPAANMVSNHLFSGIKHLVGFKTNMWFQVTTETNQAQAILDTVMQKHHVISGEANSSLHRF